MTIQVDSFVIIVMSNSAVYLNNDKQATCLKTMECNLKENIEIL